MKTYISVALLGIAMLLNGCATGNGNNVDFISIDGSFQVGDEYEIDNSESNPNEDTTLTDNDVDIFTGSINFRFGNKYVIKNSNLTIKNGEITISKEQK